MGSGHGFGKVILFGEHFVVHGIPSIASAISTKTLATVEKSEGKGIDLTDNRLAIPGYKEKKFEHQKESLGYIMKAAGLDTEQQLIKIILEGDLLAASGVGASAASCAAIARALNEEFGLGFSDEKINELAYEGERGYHGTPSGIDNTAATYGGLIWFKKGSPNTIEKIKIEKPINVVMGNTGLVADTKAAVAGVAERKEKESNKYEKIFKETEELIFEARKALELFDLDSVGELMNKNHILLQQIEVSSKELDFMVNLAKENGAIGAKLTGGGLGGYMVALTPEEKIQEKVAKAMESEGFKIIKTQIGI